IVVELKAKTAVHPVDKAQTHSHLRLLNLQVGLLINFHEEKLVDGLLCALCVSVFYTNKNNHALNEW
ncbi:MAG: GxxExxY protein, partial [Waddliaceae bacterium]